MTDASLRRRLATRHKWGFIFRYERNVYLLLLFTLGKGFQLSIGAVSINLYAYSLGYQLDFLGILVAMPAIGALLASVPIGILADRIGRKPLLLLSGFLNPLSLVAIGLSTAQLPLLIASLCNGFLSSAYWVTNLPMLTESTSDDQRVGVLAMNNFLLLGVGALGALVGGFVPAAVGQMIGQPASATVPLRWGVIAAAFVVFLPTIPLLWLREPKPAAEAPSAPAPAAPTTEAAAYLTSPAAPAPAPVAPALAPEPVGRWAVVRLFLQLLIPDMLFTTGEGAVVGLLQVFFYLRFHIPLPTIGVLYTLAGLIGGATSLTAPRFVRRYGQLRVATTMQYVSAPLMLVIGFAPFLPLSASAELGRQVVRGLFEPTYAAFAMERVSARHRATLSGFYSVTWSIGYSIGPALAGVLSGNIGLSASFIVGAGCVALSATLLRLFFGRGDQAPALR
jgi:MFS family permease